MRASLVIVLGGFAATGCAELGWDRRTPKVQPAAKADVKAPVDNPEALAAPYVTLQARPGAEVSPATPAPSPEPVVASPAPSPEPVVASKVFQVRPSPVIPPFEPIADPASTTASHTESVVPSTPPAQPPTTTPALSAATEPLPVVPDPAMPTTPALPEPSPAAGSVESSVLEAITPPSPAVEDPPSPTPSAFEGWVAGNGQASRLVGRPVSRVGNDVITLPELTATVKARLAKFPPGSEPSRREVIALAKTTLVGMVVRSLVVQEARDVMGGPARVAEAADQFGRRWDQRNRLASPSDPADPDREEFIVRSMAIDLMTRQGVAGNLDDYLDELGRRRTITSVMKESELMAAGKREAAAGRSAR